MRILVWSMFSMARVRRPTFSSPENFLADLFITALTERLIASIIIISMSARRNSAE